MNNLLVGRQHADLSRYPGFYSFKTSCPVHYPQRICRDLLIRASLDPDIAELQPAGWTDLPFADALFACRVVTRARRKCLLVLCRETSGLQIRPAHHDACLAINRVELLREPVVSTYRMVWSFRKVLIDPTLLVQTLAHVGTCRRMLIELRPGRSEPDWLDPILAMIATGHLCARLDGGLTDATEIWRAPPQEISRSSDSQLLDENFLNSAIQP